MIRALGTGVTGLTNHQIRMDVVGNNIANVNTIGFKRSRALFNEMLGQDRLIAGRFPGGELTNPNFIGLGTRINSISKNWGQGGFEVTGQQTDMAVTGDAFFTARDGERTLLTRAGNFAINRDGVLTTAGGLPILGYAADPVTGEVDVTNVTDMRIDLGAESPPRATSEMTLTGNLDAALSDNGGVNPDSFTISSNVYDAQGKTHAVNIVFQKTSGDGVSPSTYQVTVSGDATAQPFGATPLTFNVAFDTGGNLTLVDGVDVTTAGYTPPQLTWDPAFVNNTGTDPVALNLTSITQFRGASSATISSQDGMPSGKLVKYDINPAGKILLSYDSGVTRTVGQLALARVNNPNGLEMLGENFFAQSNVSGTIQLGRALNEINGTVVSGSLEMSNVDLATEFAEMIKTQRGFQANARIIRVSDEILSETVNLKR